MESWRDGDRDSAEGGEVSIAYETPDGWYLWLNGRTYIVYRPGVTAAVAVGYSGASLGIENAKRMLHRLREKAGWKIEDHILRKGE